MRISGNESSLEPLLLCYHEEADDRLMYHANHAIKVDRISKIIIASSDTDVLTCAVYQFCQWMYSDLRELWVVSGSSKSKRVLPVHDVVNEMDMDLDVLPAVHALTGCDTTSKVGTKTSSYRAATKYGFELLHSFGKSDITEPILLSAEEFLVRCLDSKSNVKTFDDLRNQMYHTKTFQLDLEKLPPTSGSIRLHILRAYLQCKLWLNAPIMRQCTVDATEYGYCQDEDELTPQIVLDGSLPDDFPMPCSCLKCARANVCACRLKNVSCCEFCKCGSHPEDCKNPMK